MTEIVFFLQIKVTEKLSNHRNTFCRIYVQIMVEILRQKHYTVIHCHSHTCIGDASPEVNILIRPFQIGRSKVRVDRVGFPFIWITLQLFHDNFANWSGLRLCLGLDVVAVHEQFGEGLNGESVGEDLAHHCEIFSRVFSGVSELRVWVE